MTTVSLSAMRATLGDAVNSVAFGRERVVIQRNGRDVAALVSMDDLELLRRMEDGLLSEEAMRRLGDESDEIVSNNDALKELGLEPALKRRRPRTPRGRRRGRGVQA